ALNRPIPRPTKAALAQNKAEEDSRREAGTLAKLMGNMRRHPDTSMASKVGEPTLVDPKPVSATDVVRAATNALAGAKENNTVSVETVRTGAPPPNQAAPRSDAVEAAPQAPPADPNEMTPNVTPDAALQAAPDPNEMRPNVDQATAPLPAPAQVNEI